MAKRTVTVEEYRCNNPKCDTIVLAHKNEPPEGYGGRVVGIDAGGGRSADWWACQQECIEPAVIGALAED